MTWLVNFSAQAEKFLKQQRIPKDIIYRLIQKALMKFRGERININLKKLGGVWEGFYRIRKGKVRIMAEFNFDNASVYIEVIDWRGNAYKS
ncbi:MAG: hypothetical protein UW30_C0028G0010 [Candidatus Giovannonibacteria bacterium GW2011_GWA2_44_13b]|uniref:Plasmid stabilization system n=1 Tax=Candidatus Giovannonibacteria bacterium GW2011_GWA2_44_13b TaxID=1618647 RepID=A0A0G1JW90_9BACT|nr:MAG: hypothetical protein UW30_C0028G0010 [Candidatus Giovannonibacteria bacterium GW2011_GWA2_44_13b]